MKPFSCPLFIGCFIMCGGAPMQAATPFESGNQAADAVIAKMELDCKPQPGEMHFKRQRGFKQGFDLGKGHWIFIVSGGKLACNPAAMCGTGGCQSVVISATATSVKTLYAAQARGWKLVFPRHAAPFLRLDSHGSHCGKSGYERCFERLDLDTGTIQ